MSTTRREFLDRLALGAAAAGGLPLALGATARTLGAMDAMAAPPPDTAWDLTWTRRLTGRHKGVFDVPEIESGYGVWRASIWAAQYQGVLAVPARELSAVLVLRHNAIVLAMRQEFWDRYGIGKAKGVTHPVTQAPTDRNPALLSSARGEQPAQFDDFALDRFLARGNVALACNLALEEVVHLIATTDGIAPEAARTRALSLLVPGVVLQPSGVFAAMRAQDVGCTYLRAS
jgi:hypothetical protein